MAKTKEITDMCKAGRTHEAYELAMADMASAPDDVWNQRKVGWTLYYMIKADAESGDYNSFTEHLSQMKSLEKLSGENDGMFFNKVQYYIAEYVKRHINPNSPDIAVKLSAIFDILKDYSFSPSIGHSHLLQVYIKFEAWGGMADFIDWWDIETLKEEDYLPFTNTNGQKIMSLAERAYIANSKALLKLNDKKRIELFLPKINKLMTQHEEMTYPGYFYGKLLLALGSNEDEALKVVIPFARKKVNDFWVWQLLSEVFTNDEEKQLACLLRAVHCRTQESFLVKVRMKLATAYIKRNQVNRARHHIEIAARCYTTQKWRVPDEMRYWMNQPWYNTAVADATEPVDYKAITDEILCNGTEECIAVVTYVDKNSQKSSMIYGYKQRMSQKIRFRTNVGDILKIHYIADKEGRIKVINATKYALPANLKYAKYIEGCIDKREHNGFAFLRADSTDCFISPAIVTMNNLNNKDKIKCLAVYDFNKKKESWNWVCVKVN